MESAKTLVTTIIETVVGWISSLVAIVTSYAGDKEKYGKWVIVGVILLIISQFTKINLNVGGGGKK